MAVVEVVAVLATMAIAYVAYRRMTVSAKYTAIHELGHAAVCRYYGVDVHQVKLNEFGTGGYTTFDWPESVKHHMVIIAAGYVAEEQARGRPIATALRGGQYEGDANIMRELVGNDKEAESVAIAKAAAILAREDVASCIQDHVELLVSEGQIKGSMLTYRR